MTIIAMIVIAFACLTWIIFYGDKMMMEDACPHCFSTDYEEGDPCPNCSYPYPKD